MCDCCNGGAGCVDIRGRADVRADLLPANDIENGKFRALVFRIDNVRHSVCNVITLHISEPRDAYPLSIGIPLTAQVV